MTKKQIYNELLKTPFDKEGALLHLERLLKKAIFHPSMRNLIKRERVWVEQNLWKSLKHTTKYVVINLSL